MLQVRRKRSQHRSTVGEIHCQRNDVDLGSKLAVFFYAFERTESIDTIFQTDRILLQFVSYFSVNIKNS